MIINKSEWLINQIKIGNYRENLLGVNESAFVNHIINPAIKQTIKSEKIETPSQPLLKGKPQNDFELKREQIISELSPFSVKFLPNKKRKKRTLVVIPAIQENDLFKMLSDYYNFDKHGSSLFLEKNNRWKEIINDESFLENTIFKHCFVALPVVNEKCAEELFPDIFQKIQIKIEIK